MSEGIDKGEDRKWLAKLLAGRISCIVGLLFGAGGILFALLGASANVSAGAVGAALGILGYFLGARRLGAATIHRAWRGRGVLHGRRQHRPHPRRGTLGTWIRLVPWVRA